jgi:hypothetical protein
LKDSVKGAGAELKALADDPDVKAAAKDAKQSLKDLGAEIKAAAKKDDAPDRK